MKDCITWYHGDCLELIESELLDLRDKAVIFGSPPWGGPGYRGDAIFDLSNMEPYSLQRLLETFRSITDDISLFLPRSSDVRQIAAQRKDASTVPVVHYCMRGASKGICAYFGQLEV